MNLAGCSNDLDNWPDDDGELDPALWWDPDDDEDDDEPPISGWELL